MATLDIRGAIVGETATAIKAPCLVATTGGNIALSGVQAVDGVLVGNNNERVLVKDQATPSQNGIYQATTGAWLIAPDFNSNTAVALGTLVLVTGGALNQGILFEQTCTDNPITIGTSAIAFSPLAQNTAQAATSTTSNSIGTGSKTFTIQSGKAFVANQYVVIYQTSNAANAMLAQITPYSGATLVANVVATGGSGAGITNWSIVLTNSQAAAGITPPMGNGNVTGPGSAGIGNLPTFADATGKVLQDSTKQLGALGTLATLTPQYYAASAIALGAPMLNGTITATSTDSNTSLTLAIKTLAGGDPSPTDPVWLIFRDGTPGNGDYTVIERTSALNLKIPAGSTLGTANNTPFRLWIFAFNNAGVPQLGVINCLNTSTGVYPLVGWQIFSISGFGGGANSAQVPYSNSGAGGPAPYGVLGYLTYETGLSTAGTYASAPTRLELWRPGVPLPGQTVQTVIGSTTTTTTTSSTSLVATSLTASISLSSATNVVRALAATSVEQTTAGTGLAGTLRRGISTSFGNTGRWLNAGAAGIFGGTTWELYGIDFPGVSSSTSYTVYIQNTSGGSGANLPFSGDTATIELQEIMA